MMWLAENAQSPSRSMSNCGGEGGSNEAELRAREQV